MENERLALVSGGNRGIGLEVCRQLVERSYSVVMGSRDEEQGRTAAARLPDGVIVRQLDVADPESVERLSRSIEEEFGRLDILVNNASSFFPVEVGKIESSHWEELIGSNLRAPLFIAQQAAAELAKNEGCIVNIVDIHAERPLKGYALYSVAKAGLAAMTRALALELAPRVRVNGVAPGAIAWPEDGQFAEGERVRIVSTTPLARTGAPEDIARAVHFLACASYVTGQILAVDGGRSIFI